VGILGRLRRQDKLARFVSLLESHFNENDCDIIDVVFMRRLRQGLSDCLGNRDGKSAFILACNRTDPSVRIESIELSPLDDLDGGHFFRELLHSEPLLHWARMDLEKVPWAKFENHPYFNWLYF
jgi:hypothetical protein